MDALADHLTLGVTVRTLITNSAESVGAALFGDLDAVFALPLEMVKGKFAEYDLGDLFGTCVCDLLLRKKAFDPCRHVHLSSLEIVVKRIARVRAVRADHNKRHSQHLYAFSDGVRKCCCRSVKAVTDLRVHKDVVLKLSRCVKHILYKRGIAYELSRGYASDIVHKPILADKSVGGCDNVERLGKKDGRRYLEVDKARMVHKIERGLVLSDLFHTDAFPLEPRCDKVRHRHKSHKRTPENVRTDRLSMRLFALFGKLQKRIVIGFCIFYFHK